MLVEGLFGAEPEPEEPRDIPGGSLTPDGNVGAFCLLMLMPQALSFSRVALLAAGGAGGESSSLSSMSIHSTFSGFGLGGGA